MRGIGPKRRGSPAGWLVFGFILLFFVLPALGRGGGNVFALLPLLAVGWLAFSLIRAGLRTTDEPAAPPRHVGPAPQPAPAVVAPVAPAPGPQAEPEPDDDRDLAELEAHLADLASLRDRGVITPAEYEAKRAEAIRTF